MIVAVDLNASPVPEDDEDDFGRQVEEYRTPEERVESAVDIAHQVSSPLFLCIFFDFIMSSWSKLALIHGVVDCCDDSFSFIAIVHITLLPYRIFIGFR